MAGTGSGRRFLVDALNETLDLARKRAVEPAFLDSTVSFQVAAGDGDGQHHLRDHHRDADHGGQRRDGNAPGRRECLACSAWETSRRP